MLRAADDNYQPPTCFSRISKQPDCDGPRLAAGHSIALLLTACRDYQGLLDSVSALRVTNTTLWLSTEDLINIGGSPCHTKARHSALPQLSRFSFCILFPFSYTIELALAATPFFSEGCLYRALACELV